MHVNAETYRQGLSNGTVPRPPVKKRTAGQCQEHIGATATYTLTAVAAVTSSTARCDQLGRPGRWCAVEPLYPAAAVSPALALQTERTVARLPTSVQTTLLQGSPVPARQLP